MILVAILLFSIASYIVIDNNIELKNVVLKSIFSFYFTLTILSFCYLFVLTSGFSFTLFELLFLLLPLSYLIFHIKKTKKFNINFAALKNQSFFVLLIILILLSVFSYNYFNASIRWGEWDAWAIWSSHAKVLTSETYFTNLFTDKMSWTHPDYPLFLPANIAVIWKSIGNYSAFVPAVLAFVTAIALVLTILTSFLEKKYTLIGLFLFFLIIYFDVLFPFVVSQYADSVFALFLLIPFVLLQHVSKENPLKMFALIGFFAASSTWIKNEGIMFFGIFSLVFFIKYYRNYKFLLNFILGTILPLSILLFFKIYYAPTNDLMNSTTKDYLERLSNFENYKIILDYSYSFIINNCKILYLSLIAILIINYKYYYSFCFVVIFVLLSAYFFVYVTTPYNLNWHLSTSLDRLLHQVTPVLLYSIFIAFAEKSVTSSKIFRVRKWKIKKSE
ncbi:MAG: hypothetical protein H7250_00030 [Flavobacterium sp.]|nr:hypothetical protein [Flavobacterium sp.]